MFTILETAAAYVDLNNASTAYYINTVWVPANMDHITWDGGSPVPTGREVCLAVRENTIKYHDVECRRIIEPNYTTVFCTDT